MADRLRVTSHFGRTGSTVHNARDFDLINAPHIDKDRVAGNLYLCVEQTEDGTWGYTWCPTQGEFVESELAYYTDRFGQSLGLQNDRHIAERHYKRVKTMEQVYHGQHTQPMEQIMQIGDKDAGTDPNIMRKAWTDYLCWTRDWSAAHGGHLRLLSSALHVDEASPHAHNRYVWEYVDDAGVVHIDQDKAMAQAGLELPDPTKPRSRYNNRAMTWSAMCRDKWIAICQGYGIDVECEPVKGRKHKTKDDYIAEQERAKDLDQRERALQANETALSNREMAVAARERAAEAIIASAEREAAEITKDAQAASERLLAAARDDAAHIRRQATPKEQRMLDVAKTISLTVRDDDGRRRQTTAYDLLERTARARDINAPTQQDDRQQSYRGREF